MTILLEANNLKKSFGGLVAVEELTIELNQGAIHALIGPNGAGKSTAINLLTGELAPDQGNIKLQGHDITELSTWQRAQAGVGRTYQITSVVNQLTVLENMLIALLTNEHKDLINLKNVINNQALIKQASDHLESFGLLEKIENLAGELSHGEQGRLEIAMCLATNPKVLLLDEPMSGMSLLDGRNMIELLNQLKHSTAILLVEHDMEAVFQLADTISVMASGKIIASGIPENIRKNPLVIEAYLGSDNA